MGSLSRHRAGIGTKLRDPRSPDTAKMKLASESGTVGKFCRGMACRARLPGSRAINEKLIHSGDVYFFAITYNVSIVDLICPFLAFRTFYKQHDAYLRRGLLACYSRGQP